MIEAAEGVVDNY